MITEIPDASEFSQAGLDYLCLAWIDLCKLADGADYYRELQESAEDQGSKDLVEERWRQPSEDLVKEHWCHEARRLTTCSALIHQGAEFLLKSQIASISPLLLLDKPWAEKNAKSDVDFGSLKTVDASVLPDLHDAILAPQLPDEFRRRLDRMRRRRNVVTHGVSISSQGPEELLKDILEIASVLVGEFSWPRIRSAYEANRPAPWADEYGTMAFGLMTEWSRVISFLEPVECKRHLDFDTTQPRFLCPECNPTQYRPDPPVKFAVLQPNSPVSDELHCFVCGSTVKILRDKCQRCQETVVSEGQECLTCGHLLNLGPISIPPLP